MDNKYDKLERMRADIKRDKEKVARMLDNIKIKQAKLREAEAERIVADVEGMKMSPEELGAFLELIKAGKIPSLKKGEKIDTSEIQDDYIFEKGDEDEE